MNSSAAKQTPQDDIIILIECDDAVLILKGSKTKWVDRSVFEIMYRKRCTYGCGPKQGQY